MRSFPFPTTSALFHNLFKAVWLTLRQRGWLYNMPNNSKVGKEAIKSQHAKGKLTAKERLEVLLDKGSFTELNADMELTSTNFDLQQKKVPGDGVITGYGRVNGKPVCVFAQ